MVKVEQKFSGGFRSDDRANTFVINRAVISDPRALIQTFKCA